MQILPLNFQKKKSHPIWVVLRRTEYFYFSWEMRLAWSWRCFRTLSVVWPAFHSSNNKGWFFKLWLKPQSGHKFTFTVPCIGSFIQMGFLWCKVFLERWNFLRKLNCVGFLRCCRKNQVRSACQSYLRWAFTYEYPWLYFLRRIETPDMVRLPMRTRN